ncbi:amidohydrolase family protein [Mameliella alba]|uniref:amidohydrolase family protein n=1 Tax=Mameliella alba TaxID=561184 RepID=UPI0039F71650
MSARPPGSAKRGGINLIHAIKMATLNSARSFHMDDRLGSLMPGRYADIVLTDSLSSINPRFVFKGGDPPCVAVSVERRAKCAAHLFGEHRRGQPMCAFLSPDQ